MVRGRRFTSRLRCRDSPRLARRWSGRASSRCSLAAPRAEDPAAIVGRVYGANTIGAVVGSLLFSLLIIPAFGTQDAQRLLIWIAGAAASATLAWRMAVAGVVAAVIASVTVAAVPPDVIAYGRQLATFKGANFLYEGEGLNSSIAVSESEGGIRNFHVGGKVEASTEVHDMRLQRMLGHMSALLHPDPKSALVVGFGAGVTAGSFV